MSSKLSPRKGTREYYARREPSIQPEIGARRVELIESLQTKVMSNPMIARVLENIQNQAYLLTAHLGERVDSHMPIFRFLRDLKESISEYRDANPDSITGAENFVDRWIRQLSKRFGLNGRIIWGTEDFGRYGPAWKYGILDYMVKLTGESREVCFQKLCEWLPDSSDSLPDWDDFEKISQEVSQKLVISS